MIAITTRSSIKVKPADFAFLRIRLGRSSCSCLGPVLRLKVTNSIPVPYSITGTMSLARMIPFEDHPGGFRPTSSRTAFL